MKTTTFNLHMYKEQSSRAKLLRIRTIRLSILEYQMANLFAAQQFRLETVDKRFWSPQTICMCICACTRNQILSKNRMSEKNRSIWNQSTKNHHQWLMWAALKLISPSLSAALSNATYFGMHWWIADKTLPNTTNATVTEPMESFAVEKKKTRTHTVDVENTSNWM